MNIELMEHLELKGKERKIDLTPEDLINILHIICAEVEKLSKRMDEMEYREKFNEK